MDETQARRALTVTQLNEMIRDMLDSNLLLSHLCIRGEISNFTHHRSGHFYFSLKDDGSLIRAVMFRSAASKVRFVPENGMKDFATGSVSAFVRDGQYQLYVTELEPDGVGALWLAYEQLRRRLEAEGLFSSARKKPLPKIPGRVGVITSPTGAAVRDIIHVIGRRFPYAQIVLYPALVQGDGAAADLIAALRYFNRTRSVDVMIIGRGGGSIEDLWAFNDEGLARAVAASEIPVISAVGHETDFTICDFAADCRAPTPSAAAELAVPEQGELIRKITNVIGRMRLLLQNRIEQHRGRLRLLSQSRALGHPEQLLRDRQLLLLQYGDRLERALGDRLQEARGVLAEQAGRLNALSPLGVLRRGYALALDGRGRVLRAAEARPGDTLTIRLQDGRVEASVIDAQPGDPTAEESVTE